MAKKSYSEWLKEIDAILMSKIGLTHADLTDQCYKDWYNDGVTPKGAASRVIRYENSGD